MIEYKQDLFSFQQALIEEGKKKILQTGGLGLFIPTGLGKTRIALKIMEEISNDQPVKCIVICPYTLMYKWKTEIKKWINKEAIILEGKVSDRLKTLETAKEGIFITNYETIRPPLPPIYCDFLIFDESIFIKTPSAKRSRGAFFLSKLARYKMILNGNPISLGLIDLYGQFRVLSQGLLGKSYYSFLYTFFYQPTMMPFVWKEKKNALEVISKIIQPYIITLNNEEKEAILKKYKIRSQIFISCIAEEYQQTLRSGFVLISNPDISNSELQLELQSNFIRLHEISSGFIYNRKPNGETEAIRLKSLKPQVIEELVCSNAFYKIIIFYNYKEEGKIISEVLQKTKRQFKLITANDSSSERLEKVDWFNKNDYSILISQISTLARGVDCYADIVIFYSQPLRYDDKKQAEDRAFRIGTKINPVIIDVVCQNTVDEVLYHLGNKKHNLNEIILEYFKKGGELMYDQSG